MPNVLSNKAILRAYYLEVSPSRRSQIAMSNLKSKFKLLRNMIDCDNSHTKKLALMQALLRRLRLATTVTVTLGMYTEGSESMLSGPLLIPMKVRSRKWAKRLIFGHVLSAAPIPNPAIFGHLP